MAHEINSTDKQQGRFQAWHGLTEIVPDLSLSDNWLRKWDLVPRRLAIVDDEGKVVAKTDSMQFVASDDNSIVIGKPFESSYTPITNAMFLDILSESVLGIDGLVLDSIGSVSSRGKIFASFKLADDKRTIGKRVFESHLNFGSSHDKSAPFWFNTSNICTVCANTFGMNLNLDVGKDQVQGRVRHTKNAAVKLGDVSKIIDAAMGAQAEFAAIFASLDETPTNETEASRIFAGYLGKGEEMSSRKANTVTRLTDLFKSGKGNSGRTLGDVFSAVTDYYTHESAGGEDMNKQFVSSEFGAGAESKREFLPLLASVDSRDDLQAKGRRSLELTAASK